MCFNTYACELGFIKKKYSGPSSLRKSGPGYALRKRGREERGEGRVIFRYLLRLHRRGASVPTEVSAPLDSFSPSSCSRSAAGAGSAAAPACHTLTGWAGRPSMADAEARFSSLQVSDNEEAKYKRAAFKILREHIQVVNGEK